MQLGPRQPVLYEACTPEVWLPFQAGPKDRVLRPAVCSTLKLEVDSKKIKSVLKKYNR